MIGDDGTQSIGADVMESSQVEDPPGLYQCALAWIQTCLQQENEGQGIDRLAECYIGALNVINRLLEVDDDIDRKDGLYYIRDVISQRCNTLNQLVLAGQTVVPARSESGQAKVSDGNHHTDDDQKLKRKRAIEDTIASSQRVTFDDVAGLQEAKRLLHEALVLPVQYPHLFTGARQPWRRILLYGPPGTGKTRIARAAASATHAEFYSVSSADLVSSWVGESEKLVRELFEHARCRRSTSIVFIDEIDSMCRKRNEKEDETTRRVKTELLRQTDGLLSSSTEGECDVFLLCATNCPWELDSAFVRRFQKRIYIPLPDHGARKEMVKILIDGSEVILSESDLETIADRMQGFSGSDISVVVAEALYHPVRELNVATHFRRKLGPGDFIMACTPSCEGAFPAKLHEIPSDKLCLREVGVCDFMQAIQTTQRTVSDQDLQLYERFAHGGGFAEA